MLGDPRKAIKSMTLPLIVSYLVVQLNLFINTAWCSGLGSSASSAISSVSPIYWIVAGIGSGLGVGASATISRYLGGGDKGKADSIAAQSLMFSVVVSLALTPILLVLLDPIIAGMGAADIGKLCKDYIKPVILSCTFVILNGVVSGILRSEGAAKKSMTVLLLSSVLNMILDPILIYGLGMGLSGAGWATSISTAISTGLGLYWYYRKRMYLDISLKGFRFKRGEVWDMLYVGVPRATESVIINIMSLFQRVFVIACGGVIAVALYNIPWRFVALAEVIPMGIGAALIPVCSAALGNNDVGKAETGYRYSFKVTMIATILISAVLFIFAEYCVMPFTYSPSMAEIRHEFVHVLRIYALFIPFVAMVDIGSSILQSLRLAQLSMVSSLLRNLLLMALFIFASTISMDAIYWSLAATEVAGGLLMMGLAHWGLKRYKRRNAQMNDNFR